ncbi:MAG: FG-GAP repeat protein [Planctomycetota bacterium]
MLRIAAFWPLLCISLTPFQAGRERMDINPIAVKDAESCLSLPKELAASDWSSIRAAYEAGRHAAFPIDGGFRFRNPGQQWSTQFDGRGFITKPDSNLWSWGLELQSYGIDEQQTCVSMTVDASANGQCVQYKWDCNVTEWYKNDTRGLEHGYTVHRRPADTEGMLVFNMLVRGNLRPLVHDSGRGVRFVDSKNAVVLNYSGLTVFDANGKRLPARFEYTNNVLRLSVSDAEAQYPLTIDPIAQQAYVKASNTNLEDRFGYAVAVSGNTVVVTAPLEDSNATGVNGDQSNNSVTDSGAAYVFVRNGSTWTQQAYLKASNTGNSDTMGFSVAASGDTIVIGAHLEDSAATGVNGNASDNTMSASGAAYVFVRSGTIWSQQAYLKASNTDTSDFFGFGVAISGDTIVVGAPLEDSNATGVNGNGADNSLFTAGAAYVFVRSGTTWSHQAYLKASNTDGNDHFGQSVGVSGDTIVVGAHDEDSNATGVNGDASNNGNGSSGAAYVFVRSGTTWTQQAYLKASNTATSDFFGYSVAISGGTIVVGARQEDSNATGVNGDQANNSSSLSGAAYVFVYSGGVWSQQAYLKASNTGGGDEFGYSVSISGDTIVVGAHAEDSSSTGINGDGTNNGAANSGAVYVFIRSGTVWSHQAYIKASNPNLGDSFSRSVSISGDIVIGGAQFEASNATGINGNQASNALTNAGAAYIFDLDNNPGTLSYGTGTPGCTGTHTLDVTHAPMINSPHFAITCSNAPPLSIGLGIVTDSQDLAGSDSLGVGVLIHSDFILATELLTFDFFSDATGYSETVGATIPNNPLLVGSTYYASALWAWPVSTCVLPGFNPYNLSTSRGLAITILMP